ncbi:MAG: MBL fold metallo-hydrolase [Clostridium beijerinckii]|nr:MBL fold metallo-hydrolase [Clostridium beijerinckii]
MSKIFIKSYPVKGGDCFLINYGKINILIDTGYKDTSNKLIEDLRNMSQKGESINLLILTHIDNDHIGGAISLLEEENIIKIDEVWYNGYKQIFNIENEFKKPEDNLDLVLKNIVSTNLSYKDEKDDYEVGYDEAKSLEELLFNKKIQINKSFNSNLILAGMKYAFDKKIEFYFLSPLQKNIDNLKQEWMEELQYNDCYENERNIYNMPKAFEFYFSNNKEDIVEYEMGNEVDKVFNVKKLASIKNSLDNTKINNSSLAFIIKIDDINLLFLGDSNPNVIISEVKKLIEKDKKFKNIKLMKVSHHGSKYNINNELLALIKVEKFLISTNGSPIRNNTATKPHIESIAKIIYSHPIATIYLNYPKCKYNPDIYDIVENYNKECESNIEIENGYDIEPLIIEI